MRINSLNIFLTRRCNYSCVYCSTDTGEDPEDKLTFDELKGLIFQAKTLGAKWLMISGQGEPFMDENIFPIIEFAAGQGLRVKVFTNGSLIEPDTAKNLYEKNVAIVFKLHSLDKALFDSLAGHVTPVWLPCFVDREKTGQRKIPAGLKHLIDAGYCNKKSSLFESLLQVEAVVVQKNMGQIKDIASFCQKLGIDLMAETLIETPCVDKTMGISLQQEQQLFKELLKLGAWSFAARQCIRCRFETNPAVDISGNIRHCSSLPAKGLGNIRDNTLKELHMEELRLRKQLNMMSPPISFHKGGFRMCATRKVLKNKCHRT
jgi:MoaA/NifB/PqqE/SkfB family radical SAM enzyme